MAVRSGVAQDLGIGHRADLLTVVACEATHVVFAVADDAIATLDAFDAGTVDHLTILSVLEHVREPQAALDGIHRVLAPGGTARVHVPTRLCRPVLDALARRTGADDRRSYHRVAQLRGMALRAGFGPMSVRMRYTLLGFVLRAELRKPPACGPWR